MVMPSAWEGFGLAAVEALSLGLPVLCSGVGGLKNIVNESCGGICSEKSQYEESIFKLLNGEVDWDQIKKNCCVRANVFSDKQSYKENLKKVYSGALT